MVTKLIDNRGVQVAANLCDYGQDRILQALERSESNIGRWTVLFEDGSKKDGLSYMLDAYPRGYVHMVMTWAINEPTYKSQTFAQYHEAYKRLQPPQPAWYTDLQNRIAAR